MPPQAWAIAAVILALLALVIELHSHTIYLLAAAAGLGAGAALGFAGLGWMEQLAATAVVMAAGFPVAAWYRRHQARDAALLPADLGQIVSVVAARDGKLRVFYRGAEWDASCSGPLPAVGSRHRVVAVHGSVLAINPEAISELETKAN